MYPFHCAEGSSIAIWVEFDRFKLQFLELGRSRIFNSGFLVLMTSTGKCFANTFRIRRNRLFVLLTEINRCLWLLSEGFTWGNTEGGELVKKVWDAWSVLILDQVHRRENYCRYFTIKSYCWSLRSKESIYLHSI